MPRWNCETTTTLSLKQMKKELYAKIKEKYEESKLTYGISLLLEHFLLFFMLDLTYNKHYIIHYINLEIPCALCIDYDTN